MKSRTGQQLFNIAVTGICLSAALFLPFLTGQNRQLGNILCLMHIPVLISAFFLPPVFSAALGLSAPLLRSVLFGMPTLYPTAAAMSAELMTYALMTGILYRLFPKKYRYLYLSLLPSMIAGRLLSGVLQAIFAGLEGNDFGFFTYVSGTFVTSLPGIAIQLALIPPAVHSVKKHLIKETRGL